MPSPAQLSVDLDALARNFHALQATTGVPVHPVVKADAYGLGALAVARRLMTEGARSFFVARALEGATLRQALGDGPTIHVLDGALDTTARLLREASLSPVLNQPHQLSVWQAAGGGPCGIQIDTGMNRLGFRPEDAPETLSGLGLVMSHLACADDPGHAMNRRQRDAFDAICTRYPGATRSLANSGGCFLGADYGFDAVRPGICLYGGGPEGRPDPRIAPVATFSAEVLQIRDVPIGETVGYAAARHIDAPVTVAIIAAGYADGLLRRSEPKARVWIGGTLRPLVGRVSMDVCAVDVTGLDVSVGDRAELFGAHHPLDVAASAVGTIGYELLTTVGKRVERTYTP